MLHMPDALWTDSPASPLIPRGDRVEKEDSDAVTTTNTARIRVTYHDTDQMGHAYYGKYLVWFEIGRTDLLRQTGRSYRQWEEEDGVYLPVTSCWIDYKRPAAYDDFLRIETTVTELSRATITFKYDIFLDETDELLATGGTRHAFTSREGKVRRVADGLLPEMFRDLHGKKASES